MECKCGGETTVKDTRKFMGTVYRKRQCLVCGNKFWTVEDEATDIEVKDLTHQLYAMRRSSHK